MLSPETNATAEEKMPGGRVTKWVKKNDKFLLGAAIGSGGAIAGAVAVAAATAPAGNGIDPAILEHAKENAVTILGLAFDANGEFRGQVHGSAFFIAGTDGRLLGTAAHNFDTSELNLPEDAEIRFFIRPDGGTLEGKFLEVKPPSGTAVDAANDIAIVDLGQTTNYTGIEIAPEGSAELGETVWSVGTPLNPRFEGTVRQVAISSLEGHLRVPGTQTFEEGESENVIQLDGVFHQGHSGGLVFDSDGRLVAIITHGRGESTITFATKSEPFKELLEGYQASPEFINLSQASFAPSSFAGGAEELASDVAIQQWVKAKSAGFSPDDGGVSDIVPVMADPSGGTGPWSPGFSPDDGGVLKNFLVIGDQSSVIGPWPPLGSSDDGGAIDSLLEALDALG